MSDLFDVSTLALATALLVVALALVAATIGFGYASRRERLPAATRYEDIQEKLAIAKADLAEKKDELRLVEQAIQERDRYAAEAAALSEQIIELRAERENLEPAKAEIDQVKQKAQEAASELAEVEAKLAEKREELERIEARLDPERLAELEQHQEELRREAETLEARVNELRAELDAALRVLAEKDQWQAQRAALEQAREGLVAQITALREERDELEQKVAPLRMEAEEARRQIAEAERLKKRVAELVQQRGALRREIENLNAQTEMLKDERTKLALLHHERQQLSEERQRLLEERNALLARTESLKALQEKLKSEISVVQGGVTPKVDPEQIIEDLVREPETLKYPAILREAPREEGEVLYKVSERLEKAGLSFPQRTLFAFHTALKVNETAQMAVLAGVSGTGKSLLPRRYAEAMGIHFLQIAVEPRWDSPQDLLGFYNYMEGRYRATELARLLAHLDPWRTIVPQDAPDRRDHMAMVLLDEMNLARIEYYFSEFLSRLEARPPYREKLAPEICADAMIPIDVRGLDNPPRLFPAHNILFVGTMNDDESTQSLSDKVLDRANVLQFPAPEEFAKGAQGEITPAGEAQSFREWRGWVRSEKALEGSVSTITEKVIRALGEIMQDFGRPFGHRLAQAIRAYVANYPVQGNAGLDPRVPLADQVEFRILPKLRGVEIDRYQEVFDRLRTLVRDELQDEQLAEQIGKLCERQRDTTGLFNWRGLARNG